MPDWSKTMQQSYEYYEVDPGTWTDKRKIQNVIDSRITRDNDADTLGSLTMNVNEPLGECYIRIYLITIQNGIKEKHPLGTYLVQTPSFDFDGRMRKSSLDAYTPLIELKENKPPLGYSVLSGENIMDIAYKLIRERARAPIVNIKRDDTLHNDFVANVDDTWITFLRDLIANAKYSMGLDEMGRIIFLPEQDLLSLQPVYTFDDGNSSILYPDISVKQDLYAIPNAVEIIYSSSTEYHNVKVINDDPDSIVSTVNRGREILYREINPNTLGSPTEEQLHDYAKRKLKELSCMEYRISYKRGYYPVRIGDCVRLNYEKAGIKNVKAKVVSQSIDCIPGCPVTETAIFTEQLWR